MNIVKRWLPYIFILAFQPFNACNSTDYCTWKNTTQHIAGKLYSCNNNTITVKSELMIGKGLHITCHDFQKNNHKFLNYLKGIDTNPHVDNFVLEYCQFADLKLVDIFHAMNISTVNTIKIMNNQDNKKATNFYNLENLTFVKNLFVQDYTSKLTDYTFNDMSALEKLYLNNVSNMGDLPEKIFNNLFNLKELTLESNNLNSLNNYIFQFNSNLSYLNIRNNNLSHLPHDLFTNLTSLEQVIMEYNKFTTVPEKLFMLCSKLWNLSLKNNLLETLLEKTFENLSNLEELNLSYNKLEFLEDKLFHPLKQLRCLHLTANRLKSINSVIFSKTKYLTALFLNMNNLSKFTKDAFQTFKYVETIDLSNNPLPNRNVNQILPCQSCRYLQTLILQNISLTEMPLIWPSSIHLHTVTSINLAYNNLTSLKWDNLPFQLGESQHIHIHLHDNNITQLPRDDVVPFIKNTCTYQMCKESEITLHLKNNKINCDCHIFHFIEHIKRKHADQLDHPKITISHAYCYWPESLRNTSLEDVNTRDLLCPLNDIYPEEGAKCPSKCSCQYRKEDNGVIVNCTGVGLNKFPNKLPNLNSKIELWFANNNLKSLKELSKMSPLPDVAVLSVSNNQLTDVHQLEKFYKLEVLELDNNKITYLTNRSISNLKKCLNLTLHNNPWKCNCQTQNFIDYIKFLADFKFLKNSLDQIQCDGNGKPIYSLENNFCNEDRLGASMIILYVLLTVFGILLIVTITLYFIFDYEIRVWMFTRKFFPKFILKPDIDNHKIYDVFVSVSNKDQNFIMDHLIPQLENNFCHNYKLFIQSRDYVSGGWIANQIKNTIRDSSRVIFILSKNYVEREWSQADFRASHLNAIQDYSPKIIVILLDQVKIEDLDTESKPFVVKKTLRLCESGFWEKLRYELPHPPAYSKPNRRNGTELRTRTFQC